jgi:hypothetical protein
MKILWTEEMDIVLMNLLESKDMPYREVAVRLSIAFDLKFTKNACVGRARRLRLPPRPPKVVVLPSFIVVAPPKPRKKGEPITILELRDGVCHWPLAKVEDHPPYLYCGRATVDLGCSWCQIHANIAFGKATSGSASLSRSSN